MRIWLQHPHLETQDSPLLNKLCQRCEWHLHNLHELYWQGVTISMVGLSNSHHMVTKSRIRQELQIKPTKVG